MNTRNTIVTSLLLTLLITLLLTTDIKAAPKAQAAEKNNGIQNKEGYRFITQAEREAAADRAKAAGELMPKLSVPDVLGGGFSAQAVFTPGPNSVPDYFGIYPNYALSTLPALATGGAITMSGSLSWYGVPGVFDATKAKITSGDYNADGIWDIAILYDYGNATSRLWVLISNGTTFTPSIFWDSGVGNWDWARSKLASGDFNNDGSSDICVLYDYGSSNTAAIVMESNTAAFTPSVYWSSGPGNWDWNGTKVVAGDYNNDGFDDILALYNYGSANTAAIALRSNGTAFTPTSLWSSGPGNFDWNLAQITGGDFNGDSRGDIMAFYDYGGANTGAVVLQSNGTALAPNLFWTSGPGNFEAARAKIVGGDFNGGGIDDVTALYNYGGATAIQLFFQSNGTSLTPNVSWSSGPGNFDAAGVQITSGNYDGDANGIDEFSALYDYGNVTANVLTYKSSGMTPIPGTGIRKFMDSLPGLTTAGANNIIQAHGFGQYIPVAEPDTAKYPTTEYFEIAVVQYTEKMHTDIPPTTLRGYVQLVTPAIAGIAGHNHTPLFYPDGVTPIMYGGVQAVAMDPPSYLGPTVVANRNVPTRVKFVNLLPTGMGGDLMLPTDTTVMGSGMGPNMVMATAAAPVAGLTVQVTTAVAHPFVLGEHIHMSGFTPAAYNGAFMITAVPDATHFQVMLATDPLGPATVTGDVMANYTQNRATLHLHGGATPWISDGTPHQWITPAGEPTSYPQGVSVVNVPDMAGDDTGPTDGSMTFYYTNQQSARLMFYHDHAYGITRLNVYAGEAAPYVLRDTVEDALINGGTIGGQAVAAGTIPADEIPLVIQDKTFVPDNARPYTSVMGSFASQLIAQDPTWDTTKWGGPGSLWTPHVYMPNQNPADIGGMNAMGRWFYGPWFHPPTTGITYGPIPNPYYDPINAPLENSVIPGTPDARLLGPSMGMEMFMDTPVVNGTAYPYLEVQPKAYRLRILNAADDRFFNLQLYVADPNTPTPDGRTMTEVKMVPAAATAGYPASWPTDGRAGGVPDPATVGPAMIQIGNEGGFLPAPVTLPNQPVTWNLDQTNFDFGNVNGGTLILGTAERADVIVDFSQYAGRTLILYNDSPAPFPALDPRYDYYTGSPDKADTGGAPYTLAGYGPNTRTIMQIRVANTTPAPPYNKAPLEAAFASTATTQGVFAVSQDPVIVPNDSYNSAYNQLLAADPYARIADFSSTFTPLNAATTGRVGSVAVTAGGSGYVNAPDVVFTPTGGGTGATATSTLSVNGVVVTNGGTGYTTAPTVSFSGGGGTGAAGTATIAAGAVTGVTITNGGSGYTTMPAISFTGGGGANAAADATGAVSAVNVTNGGLGYLTLPTVSFVPIGAGGAGATATASYNLTIEFEAKSIQDEMGEAFEKDYGRMSGFMGLEIPRTNFANMNFLLYPFASPPVDNAVDSSPISATPIAPVAGDGTQIWKITHNGVDTHTIHFHLFNVQLLNRVAWDNALRLPDANELGWKETVRVNPLQDTIVALRPVIPTLPFTLPNSVRLIDPTQPQGTVLTGGPLGFQDPLGNPTTITNEMVNFGWEYVYHCHILSHEEMDMMHAMNIAVAPAGAPSGLTVGPAVPGPGHLLNWTDNSTTETGFTIEWAPTATGPWGYLTTVPAAGGTGTVMAYTDPFVGTRYYRVAASNTPGALVTTGLPFPNFPMETANSAFTAAAGP